MRDRDAERKIAETYETLGGIVEVFPRVRRKLREWASGGYAAGAGESSTGSDRHSDPSARAVIATEITDTDGNHTGWRDVDPYGQRLTQIDKNILDIVTRVRALDRDMRELDNRWQGVAELGCELCAAVRLPLDPTTGSAQHKCSPECATNEHRHPDGYKPIHNRTAPPALDGHDPVPNRARCSWHWNFAKDHGVDAHPALTLFYLDGGRLGSRRADELIATHHATRRSA